MKKWNLIVDVPNCTNCNVCALAVQDEHVGNDFPGYSAPMPKHGHRWIEILRKERGAPPSTDVAYVPMMCQHCDEPACQKAAPDAVTKRKDGIVIIDPDKSKGRREIVDACPFGAVWWNEELNLPQHWTFDAHLLDAGQKHPRCVTVCATNAFEAVKLTDTEMQERIRDEGLEPLRPDLDGKPRVHYRNLWRYNRIFVAGTVSQEGAKGRECVEGAQVTVSSEGKTFAEGQTDAFGDFKLDRLNPDGRVATLKIVFGEASAIRQIELNDSVTVGEIEI